MFRDILSSDGLLFENEFEFVYRKANIITVTS